MSPLRTEGRLPDFLLVGAAKCGTTSLYAYLAQHPDVFMCPRKEPNFFTDESNRNRVTEGEYRRLFAGAGDARAVGEASVSYLYSPGAASAVESFLGPSTRILVLLRNPVDMAYSLWGHMVRAGGERLPFLEALRAERSRLADEAFRREAIGWIHSYAYLSRARYAEQVERYLQRFGPGVGVWTFEEFFGDPAAGFREVCRFLGVPDRFTPRFGVHNPTGPVISTWLRDVVNERRSWKEPLKALLPRAVRRGLKKQLYWWNRRNDVPLPPLAPEVRQEVWGLFEDDVRRLEGLLGRRLRGLWGAERRRTRPVAPVAAAS